jgi:hypothetical protein
MDGNKVLRNLVNGSRLIQYHYNKYLDAPIDAVITSVCEGLPGVYSTIWCLWYRTNKLKKKKEEGGNRPSQIGREKG